MGDYTVYRLPASSLGDPVGDADLARINALLDEEVRARGLADEASVVVGDTMGRASTIPAEGRLRRVVDRAFARFNHETAAGGPPPGERVTAVRTLLEAYPGTSVATVMAELDLSDDEAMAAAYAAAAAVRLDLRARR